ncbi:MAG: hypothetical protein LAQ30_31110 [Acidobacteriia bacterium]|nr:hypothetical protein [Terriglobia bacterium]
MPGNLQPAAPDGVMPFGLCTAFAEVREYAQLQNQYHDGTIQRSQLAQTSRRTFRLSRRLSASALTTIYTFWAARMGGPFAFYNPFDVADGAEPGSNYDPTGNNTQGRVTVAFRSDWAQSTGLCRTDVQGLELVEVA